MFNRTTYVDCGTRGPSHVTVHEHRAPTDESVKTLRQMEREALDRILATVPLRDTPISGVVHSMVEHLSCNTRFAIVYKVGGEERRVDHVIGPLDSHDRLDVLKALRDKLAEDIADGLLSKMLHDGDLNKLMNGSLL